MHSHFIFEEKPISSIISYKKFEGIRFMNESNKTKTIGIRTKLLLGFGAIIGILICSKYNCNN